MFRSRIVKLVIAWALLPMAAAASVATPEDADGPSKKGAAVDAAVDINTAGVRELESLPGIGPALAKRIVEFRDAHGSFKKVEELLAVKGIGPRLLEKLRPRLRAGRAKAAR